MKAAVSSHHACMLLYNISILYVGKGWKGDIGTMKGVCCTNIEILNWANLAEAYMVGRQMASFSRYQTR
jgi:hypothetical protein